MIARSLVLAALIAIVGVYGRHAAGAEQTVQRAELSSLPSHLGAWTLADEPALDGSVLDVLGVTDYTNRVYVNEAGVPAGLYVGYYASQRQGDTIHSPQNCLPGAGWQPVSSRRSIVESAGLSAPVNEYVIQKGLDRQVVLYWYEGRGRIVANEYVNKFWLMLDAARLHRSNGSLVRIIVPAASGAELAAAAQTAHQFAVTLLPHLPAYLP